MLIQRVEIWLLLLFTLLLRCSKCLAFTCQETDHCNLASGMVGFDPFVANAYEQFNPGFKNLIFEPTGKVFESKFNTYSLPNTFSNYLMCSLKFTNTVLTNFSHYQAEKNRFVKTEDETDDQKPALNEVNVDSDGLEEGTEEKIIRDFFLETGGEIVQTKMTCTTQALAIRPFSRPVFTADFSAALQMLQLAANNSESEYSKKIYRTFVDTYGTHYMKKSMMGAEIIFQKLFAERAVDDRTKQTRQNCIDRLARKRIYNGAAPIESVIIDFSELSQTCDNTSLVKEYFNSNGIESSRVIINGPPPIGTMEQWSTAVKQSPIPINFILEKINSLFLRNRIESSLLAGDGSNSYEGTSDILLYNFLESEYARYCSSSSRNTHCSPEFVNCDANNDCPPGSRSKIVSDHEDSLDEDECSTTPGDIESPTFCPDNYLPFGTGCFLFVRDRLTWDEARTNCERLGGRLAQSLDQDCVTLAALLTYIEADPELSVNDVQIWLGGSDSEVEGQWKWLDGANISMSSLFWHNSQPDNWNGYEDCLSLYITNHETQFNDLLCSTAHLSVCSAEPIPPSQ